jgi:hypothetical protein
LYARRRSNIGKSPKSPKVAEEIADASEPQMFPNEQEREQAQESRIEALQDVVIRENSRFQTVTQQDRANLETEIREEAVRTVKRGPGVYAELESDLADFQRRSKLIDYQSKLIKPKEVEKENEILKTAKNIFSTVLIADFFVVIVFLVWFLAAAALQKTYTVVLERFQDIFQPVVVPSLTVLMVGSIASGVTSDENKNK